MKRCLQCMEIRNSAKDDTQMDIDKILNSIGTDSVKHCLSMKFRNAKVEQDFIKDRKLSQLYFSKILMAVYTIVIALNIFIAILNFKEQHNTEKLIFQILLSGAVMTQHVILFFFGRKYILIRNQFSNIAILVMSIYTSEFQKFEQHGNFENDAAIVVVAVAIIAAPSNYCQTDHLIILLLNQVYLFVRNYLLLKDSDMPRFLKLQFFYLVVQAIYHLFSRTLRWHERKQYIEKKDKSQILNLFHSLIKVFHDGILISRNDQIIFSNDRLADILNIKKELDSDEALTNVIKKQLQTSYVQNPSNKEPQQNAWDYLISQELHDSEEDQVDQCFMLKQGEDVKTLQVFSQSIGNNIILGTVRDISQMIEVQKQKNLSKMKTIAFAQAAHEFRQPLSAMLSSIELLEDKVDHERGGHFYKIVKNSAAYMRSLINDILDFSQLEHSKMLVNIETFDISEVFSYCFDILEYTATIKGIHCVVDVIGPIRLTSDINRLRQVIINFASNAIKYTDTGHVKLSAILKIDKVEISISDTGVGIETCELPELFSTFKKIDRNREMNQYGCGLGLTIAKNITEALKGSVSVASQVHVGSVFTVILPVNYNDESHETEARVNDLEISFRVREEYQVSDELEHVPCISQDIIKTTYASKCFQFEKNKDYFHECRCPWILIVDDDPFCSLSLQATISTFSKLQIATASNGKIAVDMVQTSISQACSSSCYIRVVFLDRNMPRMGGIEAAKIIRSSYGQSIKLVLLSGEIYSEHDDLFDWVILKPFTVKSIKDVLAGIID